MNLGEFRKGTAHLPDSTPLLVGFQEADGDRFVVDGNTVLSVSEKDLQKKYGWEAFGALPAPPVTLFTFDPKARRPPKPKAAATETAS